MDKAKEEAINLRAEMKTQERGGMISGEMSRASAKVEIALLENS